MQKPVELEQFYRHTDGGIYFTQDVARSTVDLTDHVVYSHVYPFEQRSWIRPISEWTEDRFEPITITEVFALMDSTVPEEYQAVVTANKQTRKSRK